MAVEGTKSVRWIILYSAIIGHFIWQMRCRSMNAETDVYLHRWSTYGNINREHHLTVLYHAKILKNKDVNYLGTNTLYTVLFWHQQSFWFSTFWRSSLILKVHLLWTAPDCPHCIEAKDNNDKSTIIFILGKCLWLVLAPKCCGAYYYYWIERTIC